MNNFTNQYQNSNQQQKLYQNNDHYSQPVSIGEWVVALVVLMIPLVNIIMFIYWAIAAKNPSKRNFFRANLLIFGIFLALSLLIILFAGN